MEMSTDLEIAAANLFAHITKETWDWLTIVYAEPDTNEIRVVVRSDSFPEIPTEWNGFAVRIGKEAPSGSN